MEDSRTYLKVRASVGTYHEGWTRSQTDECITSCLLPEEENGEGALLKGTT